MRGAIQKSSLLILAVVLSTPLGQADPIPGSDPSPNDSLQVLAHTARGRLDARFAPETGAFTFVRATGREVLAKDDPSADPLARALGFLRSYGAVVGMTSAERRQLSPRPDASVPGTELRLARVDTDISGKTHVRLNQLYRGIPVRGGQLVVHMNDRGVTAVSGTFVPDVAVEPVNAMSAEEAANIALLAVGKTAPGVGLVAAKTDLSVYRTGLLEGFFGENRLAYAVEVSGSGLRDQVWVDAMTGAVLQRIPLIHRALDRCVYTPTHDPENPDRFVVRREGDPPTNVPPIDNLYDFTGQVYDLFSKAFGRDSYDGLGHKMRTVYLVNEACPNAYWNGETTNYCPGFDLDDVVAHEWGHAYTQYTHGLIYAYQQGALNESYSDIWGEVVDLTNGVDGIGGGNNNDAYPEGQRWLIGEDLGPLQPLLLRDMWDPERLGYPGKVSSENYVCDAFDAGGVHSNSSVSNHAFAMLVDGKTYNGQTVEGIGLTKAAHIYYQAMTSYQTPTTNFAAHAQALKASCQDLLGIDLRGLTTGLSSGEAVTQGDCEQLDKDLLAVEMSAPPTQCNFQPLLAADAPPVCSGASTVFSEDWETGMDGWTLASSGVNPEWPGYNWAVAGSLPEGRAGSAAFAVDERAGTCASGGDISGQFTLDSSPIAVPASAENLTLRFDHYVETEPGYDGGNLKISVNGAEFELVPHDAYVFNGPSVAFIDPPPNGNNTNPKAGELGWSGADEGEVTGSWGTTVVDLTALASPGESIRLRFDFGIDGCNGITGWFVDDVRLYVCPQLAAPALTIGAGYEDPDANGSYTLTWTRPAGASGPDTLQETTTSLAPLLSDAAESGMGNWNLSTEGTGTFGWETSGDKPQHPGTAFRARAEEGATNASSIMTWKQSLAIPAGTTTLRFSDWFMSEGDDKGVVEVSEDGVGWAPVYTAARAEAVTDAVAAFETEPLSQQEVDLSGLAGKTIALRFRYAVGPDNRPASTPFGWYVDDVALVSDNWSDVGTTGGTSLTVSGRGNGTYGYRVRTTYTFGQEPAPSPTSNVVVVVVDLVDLPDLTVTSIVATSGKSGKPATIAATLANLGAAVAGPSKTEFLLDGSTVLGFVDTPAIAPGSSATVSVSWDTRHVKGTHTIRVAADRVAAIVEADEGNNAATLTVTVRGNKVENGSFEQDDAPGASAQSGAAGLTTEAARPERRLPEI